MQWNYILKDLMLQKDYLQEQTVKNLELDIANLAAQLGDEITQAQVDTARTDLDTAKQQLTPHTAELIQLQVKSKRLQDLTDEIKSTKEIFTKKQGSRQCFRSWQNDLLTQRTALDAATQQDQIDVIDLKIKENWSQPSLC